MHDRYQELLALGKNNPFQGEDEDVDDAGFLEGFFKDSEIIRTELSEMKTKTDELQNIYGEVLDDFDAKSKKKKGKDVETLIQAINDLAQRIRDQLKRLGNTIIKESDDGFTTEERIKKNLHTSLLNEFLEIMQCYQSLQNKHNEEMRSIVKNQVLIVKPNATEDEVEQVIQSGSDQIFITNSARGRAAQDSLNYIKDRHNEILQLEKSLEEVHQLFVDMAVLVKEQSEKLNRIAFQVQNVKRDVLAATDELKQAQRIKKKTCVVQ